MVDLLVVNIGELVTLAGSGRLPRRGAALRELGIVRDGAVAISGGEIVAAGAAGEVRERIEVGSETEILDAGGGTVLPGFVDPHTHLVFAGTREHEYAMRVGGATYEEILAAGGGIHSTTRLTREASEEELYRIAHAHLDVMMLHGSTTIEAKSGYGLDLESELKLLRVLRRLGETHPVDIVTTFLGAHVVPAEYRGEPERYVDLIVEEMLPRVAREGLADYCDVWCDEGIFTERQSRRILERARALGMGLRLHANQLSAGGGAALGVELAADSVDHLERLPPEMIPVLASSETVAVLVPGVALTLGEPDANARALIDAGAAVALATDFNPGSCYTESMPLILTLACARLRMTPAEALVAATHNAACSLGRGHRVGALEAGKQADLIVLSAPNHAHLPYHMGVNLVASVVKRGRVVVREGQLVARG